MQVFVGQPWLQSLFGFSPKLIVPSIDVEICSILQPTQGLSCYEFQLEGATSQATIALVGASADAELIEIQYAPAFCLAFLTASEMGQKQIEPLVAWWRDRARSEAVPPCLHVQATENLTALKAAFWERMFAQVMTDTVAMAGRLSDMQRQYLELRSLHENTQNAFAAVEGFLSQAKLPALQLSFENSPVSKFAAPPHPNAETLKQLLPLPSRGLASLEIHLTKYHPSAKGTLSIELQLTEDQSRLAGWKIPYPHLLNGWFRLDLPSIDIQPQRDVELVIQWQTELGPPPCLSLGALQAIPEVRAVLVGDRVLDNSLAMRLWTGLPGTRRVLSPYLSTFSQHLEPSKPMMGYLGEAALSRVLEVTPNLATESFPHIQVFEEGTKLLTHPREVGLTVAMLPFCFPVGATHVTATVLTEHPEAKPIEYAMALVKEGVDPLAYFQGQESHGAFSGWIAVASGTPHQIKLSLDAPAADYHHIVVGTRISPGGATNYAWAYWLNFLIEARSLTASKSLPQPHVKSELPPTFSNSPVESRFEDYSQVFLTPELPKPGLMGLGVTDLSRLREVSTTGRTGLVTLLEDGAKIQTHPQAGGETIALLPSAVPPNTIAISTAICTNNPKAAALEYGLAVIAEDDDESAQLAVTTSGSALVFSGWRRVEPNTQYPIEVHLPSPTKQHYHLVLATRLPDGSVADYGWAQWFDIHFELSTPGSSSSTVAPY